jgi:hypothetical protein
MNRRSFFKTVCGAVAGVVAAFVPGKKTEKSPKEVNNEAMQKVETTGPMLGETITMENTSGRFRNMGDGWYAFETYFSPGNHVTFTNCQIFGEQE